MNTPSEFNAYLSTVAHCSRDKEGKRILIDSSESVVNFDAVKEDYAKKNSPDQTPHLQMDYFWIPVGIMFWLNSRRETKKNMKY